MILVLFMGTLITSGQTKTASGPPPAPTFYVAIHARACESKIVRFNGASNLPQGAMLTIKVSEPYQDAFKDYSDGSYVPVDSKGFFEGEVPVKAGIRFQGRLILIVNFTTYRPKQPEAVLQVVGKIGEKLGGLENPQVQYLSGNYQILQAVDVTPSCGEGVTHSSN
jgi:hypothetical protein